MRTKVGIIRDLFGNGGWVPISEEGEVGFGDFDQRFPVDQSYQFYRGPFHCQVRLVQHPDVQAGCLRVFRVTIWRDGVWRWLRPFLGDRRRLVSMWKGVVPVGWVRRNYGRGLWSAVVRAS